MLKNVRQFFLHGLAVTSVTEILFCFCYDGYIKSSVYDFEGEI